MKKVAVFCGSSAGRDSTFSYMADELGTLMAKNGLTLVYGGANIGIMGNIANSVLEGGGTVYGVIPKSIVGLEIAHKNLSKLIVTESMHERKAQMYDLAELFWILPGGFGTLDEFFEILTWAQLKYHQKPIYLLNFQGFYDFLIKHLDSLIEKGFMKRQNYFSIYNEIERMVQDSI